MAFWKEIKAYFECLEVVLSKHKIHSPKFLKTSNVQSHSNICTNQCKNIIPKIRFKTTRDSQNITSDLKKCFSSSITHLSTANIPSSVNSNFKFWIQILGDPSVKFLLPIYQVGWCFEWAKEISKRSLSNFWQEVKTLHDNKIEKAKGGHERRKERGGKKESNSKVWVENVAYIPHEKIW